MHTCTYNAQPSKLPDLCLLAHFTWDRRTDDGHYQRCSQHKAQHHNYWISKKNNVEEDGNRKQQRRCPRHLTFVKIPPHCRMRGGKSLRQTLNRVFLMQTGRQVAAPKSAGPFKCVCQELELQTSVDARNFEGGRTLECNEARRLHSVHDDSARVCEGRKRPLLRHYRD